MLNSVQRMEDGQASHKLLTMCLGSCRLMHAMRTTRPDWISDLLRDADSQVIGSLESCMGLALGPTARRQASLPIACGGLGLRSAERHAAAAYISSKVASRDLCGSIDPGFVWDADDPGSGLAAAIGLYNIHARNGHGLTSQDLGPGSSLNQKSLSKRLDKAERDDILEGADIPTKARLRAAGAPHAGAWLAALPNANLDQRMNHGEFVAALKLVLGVPFRRDDTWCPRCDQILDRRCWHSLACMSGGDCVRLHNALRDRVYVKCLSAGLAPERERRGLLPDDPRRRPGDIFFAEWPGGQGIALDFAITSPLQLSTLEAAADSELAAAKAYEATKNADRANGERCREHGVRLVPMVAESLGGWGPEAQKIFKVIGRSLSGTSGATHGAVVAQLYENLGVLVMRAAARSALVRQADAASATLCPAVGRAETVMAP